MHRLRAANDTSAHQVTPGHDGGRHVRLEYVTSWTIRAWNVVIGGAATTP
ncbi:hypothetical protein [Blastococcus sp. TF02-09]|nr:hypothetical protein [Blastococcus sp. TF02-9]